VLLADPPERSAAIAWTRTFDEGPLTPGAGSSKTDEIAGESESESAMNRSTQEEWSVSRSVTTDDMIRAQRFGTARRGFDPVQVSAFLNRVADQVATLEARVAELESDLVARPADVSSDPYETVSSHVVALMKAFDEDVSRLRGEAEAEADRMIADAKVETERIRSDAETRAKEALAAASGSVEGIKRDAEEELAQLMAKRTSITGELRVIRERLLVAIEQLPKADTPETSAPANARDVVEIVDEPAINPR
jgi:cell division initiation protein